MNTGIKQVLVVGVAAACAAGCAINKGADTNMSGTVEPSVVVKPFGKTKDGQLVHQYTLTGAGGVVMDVIDYGGKVVRLFTPDRSGKTTDITLGFNDVSGYEKIDPYFGSLIGRYGNRIAHGKFTLEAA
jgi:aldose 1-epimerase